jgi:hypothetical protein
MQTGNQTQRLYLPIILLLLDQYFILRSFDIQCIEMCSTAIFTRFIFGLQHPKPTNFALFHN